MSEPPRFDIWVPTPTTQLTPSVMSPEAVLMVQIEPHYPIEAAQMAKKVL
ncbi:hypothetical protein [Shewanella acanthi]|nr:hypothetical protein [Shewanella acanthi]